MDHRAVLASLTPQDRARLTAKSNRAGLLPLARHGGAIVLFGALITARAPFWPLLMLPQGVLIVFWNMSYHTEHHSYPAVPFHRLPDLHAAMAGGHLLHVEPGYVAFHRRYLRSLVSR